MSWQYSELRPTNGWDQLASLGHSSKFQRVSRLGFATAVTSVIGGQPNLARCLTVSWAGTLYIDRILPGAKFTLRPKSCILLYWQRYCTALKQRVWAEMCSVLQGMELRNFLRGCHLYWPSRWASAHILVSTRMWANVMVALPNTGGALCSMLQSFADAHYLTAVQ